MKRKKNVRWRTLYFCSGLKTEIGDWYRKKKMSKFPEAMHHNEYIDIFPASNDFCDKMKEKKCTCRWVVVVDLLLYCHHPVLDTLATDIGWFSRWSSDYRKLLDTVRTTCWLLFDKHTGFSFFILWVGYYPQATSRCLIHNTEYFPSGKNFFMNSSWIKIIITFISAQK